MLDKELLSEMFAKLRRAPDPEDICYANFTNLLAWACMLCGAAGVNPNLSRIMADLSKAKRPSEKAMLTWVQEIMSNAAVYSAAHTRRTACEIYALTTLTPIERRALKSGLRYFYEAGYCNLVDEEREKGVEATVRGYITDLHSAIGEFGYQSKEASSIYDNGIKRVARAAGSREQLSYVAAAAIEMIEGRSGDTDTNIRFVAEAACLVLR